MYFPTFCADCATAFSSPGLTDSTDQESGISASASAALRSLARRLNRSRAAEDSLAEVASDLKCKRVVNFFFYT